MRWPNRLWPALLLLFFSACAAPKFDSLSDGEHAILRWSPDERPKGIFLGVHGFNDYSAAFEMFGIFAASHGYATIAYDQAGFGQRANAGRWPGAQRLADELNELIERTRHDYPDVPIFALGVSMGAAVVVLGASQDPRVSSALASRSFQGLDGLILAAPAVWGDNNLNPLYRAILWTTAQVAPGWRLTGRGLSFQPTDNIEILREMASDPAVLKDTRVDSLLGLIRLMDATRNIGPELDPPVLVLVGEKDKLVPEEAIESFAKSVREGNCWIARYPNGWHMLLRDLDAEIVWNDILSWAEERKIPSGHGAGCGSSASPELIG